MATFSVGTSTPPRLTALQRKSQPAVRIAKFGDGYEQRVQFGMNQNSKVGICVEQPQKQTDAMQP
jgi:phage-related protein